MGDMLGAEFEAAARNGSILDFASPGEDGEDGGGDAANDGDIDVVKDGGEIVETEICKYREHQHHNEDIAQANSHGKGNGLFETMVYTILYQGEKGRTQTKKQGQQDAADYANQNLHSARFEVAKIQLFFDWEVKKAKNNAQLNHLYVRCTLFVRYLYDDLSYK